MDYVTIVIITLLLFWIGWGVCCYNYAEKRHRNKFIWFCNGFLVGLLGVFLVASSKDLEYDQELEIKGNDTLGYVTFGIFLIWGIIEWYYILSFVDYLANLMAPHHGYYY